MKERTLNMKGNSNNLGCQNSSEMSWKEEQCA